MVTMIQWCPNNPMVSPWCPHWIMMNSPISCCERPDIPSNCTSSLDTFFQYPLPILDTLPKKNSWWVDNPIDTKRLKDWSTHPSSKIDLELEDDFSGSILQSKCSETSYMQTMVLAGLCYLTAGCATKTQGWVIQVRHKHPKHDSLFRAKFARSLQELPQWLGR